MEEITIDTWVGEREVGGYVCDDCVGLAVTTVPGMQLWTVTHIASGRRLQIATRDAESAMSLALALAPLADWTMSDDDVWGRPNLLAAGRAVLQRAMESGDFVICAGPDDERIPAHVRASSKAWREQWSQPNAVPVPTPASAAEGRSV